MIGFLDLLGFSAAVERHWGTPKSPLPLLMDLKAAVPQYGPAVVVNKREPPRTIIGSISDSIIVRVPVPAALHADDYFAAIFTGLMASRMLVQEAASKGFAIRGGLELGQVYWEGDEVIGPAFNHAYGLESKAAGVARVVLGPNILDHASNWNDRARADLAGCSYAAPDGLWPIFHPESIRPTMERLRAACYDPAHARKYDECLWQMECERRRAPHAPEDLRFAARLTRTAMQAERLTPPPSPNERKGKRARRRSGKR